MKLRTTDALRFAVVEASGETTVYDLGEDTAINEADLSGEFAKQASLQAWWGVMMENALHALRDAETEFDTFLADLSCTVRAQATADKLTEGKVDAIIKSNTGYAVHRHHIDELRHRAELLKVAIRAVEEKGRMLISLGAHKRQEMEMQGLRLFKDPR